MFLKVFAGLNLDPKMGISGGLILDRFRFDPKKGAESLSELMEVSFVSGCIPILSAILSRSPLSIIFCDGTQMFAVACIIDVGGGVCRGIAY